ncbi:sensor histidine kinase [Rhizobium alvei]|uniref:histidine kinase n=1 Tax=Rhizobium alvei TaxID=1132659 RepID=A0ABT8YL31_9HYPH|nr:HAMP domain-containing sensor histidine kinase [Rhizobium alvei]MDO6964338.1 HAMP domain-containing sensor histidine kinase [Rhizobium alvei]
MMSIRVRFALISLASVTIALVFAAWFLIALFEESYRRRIDAELSSHISRLAGDLRFDATGKLLAPASPADNRFFQIYSGLYWQVFDADQRTELRSPSLFDYALPLPNDGHPAGTIHHYRLNGPEGAEVIVLERALQVVAPGGTRLIRIAVALDAAALDSAKRDFAGDLLPYITALAAFLVIMSLVQLKIGLKPLDKVADDLENVRQRKLKALPGPYPRELAPLVARLNQLLESQAQAIERARQRASDLAHGLKTPLTVISNDALTLRERGETEIAEELDMLAGSMLAHIDHELARSRIANTPDQRRSDVQPGKIVRDLVKTLNRTEAGERLDWSVELDADPELPIDPNDLREMLGNLFENASKWARSRIRIATETLPDRWTIQIADDGPGVPDDDLARLTVRGVRLDHRKPGSGLGLSIVREIIDVYGLDLTLENRPEGGFEARVSVPLR